jgi:peptide/nickel transport system substrate-binding protein
MAERLTPAQVHALKGAPHVKVVSVPFASQVALVMDNKSKPFDDVRVRRAMAYAVPYANIIKNVFFGLAKPTAGPVATQFPGHYQKGYPYGKQNLAKAKSLLAAAGYPNGFTVNLAVSTGYPVHQPMAVLIRDALQRIGVTVNIQTLTPAVFQQQTGQHAINFFLENYVWWVPDPAYAMALGYACGEFFNFANWCNKTFDQKLAVAFGETNKKKRTQEFAELQKIAWTDMPVVWITQPNVNVAMRDNVTGYHLMNDGITRFVYLRKK